MRHAESGLNVTMGSILVWLAVSTIGARSVEANSQYLFTSGSPQCHDRRERDCCKELEFEGSQICDHGRRHRAEVCGQRQRNLLGECLA